MFIGANPFANNAGTIPRDSQLPSRRPFVSLACEREQQGQQCDTPAKPNARGIAPMEGHDTRDRDMPREATSSTLTSLPILEQGQGPTHLGIGLTGHQSLKLSILQPVFCDHARDQGTYYVDLQCLTRAQQGLH